MFVYITTNLINDKKYIGACSRNDDNYLGSGSVIKSAIEKYGKENFKRQIIEYCNDIDHLYEQEKYWISYYNAVESKEYYNLCEGGKGGNSNILKEYWSSIPDNERTNARKWKWVWSPNRYGKCENRSKSIKKIWDSRSDEEKRNIASKIVDNRRSYEGDQNPMSGRSAVTEKNLRWYTNGKETKYMSEGTQPEGFWRGRK